MVDYLSFLVLCNLQSRCEIQKRPFRSRAQAMAATAAPPKCAAPEIWLSPYNNKIMLPLNWLENNNNIDLMASERQFWSSKSLSYMNDSLHMVPTWLHYITRRIMLAENKNKHNKQGRTVKSLIGWKPLSDDNHDSTPTPVSSPM